MAAIWVLLGLSFSLLTHLYHVSGLNPEGQALLRFRSSFSPEGIPAMANWVSSDPSPCSWTGVTCKNQSVIAINLPKSELSGPLDPSLSSLSSLRHVNLRGNDLQGPLPAIVFPAELQSLVLSSNSLSGPLHISLLSLRRLKILDLAGNRFSGGLPAGFASAFPQLELLNLSFNGFSGELPGDLPELGRLRGVLDLSHNSFSGELPASLGDLPESVFIDLSFNNLSGAVPGSLAGRGAALVGNPGLVAALVGNPGLAAAPNSRRRGLAGGEIAAIVAGDVAAVALMGVVFVLCYRRTVAGAAAPPPAAPGDERRRPGRPGLEFLGGAGEFDLEGLLKSPALVLGKSQLGILYKVVFDSGLTVAVRRLGEGGSQRYGEFKAEVAAIAELRHPNLVPIRAYFWSPEEKLLVYDYFPGGSLADAVHGGRRLRWKTRLRILRGVATGLTFLHECSPRRYVHGDLKPSNVLLGAEFEPQIADFGLRRLVDISSPAPVHDKPPPARNQHYPAAGERLPLMRNCHYLAAEALPLPSLPSSPPLPSPTDGHYRAPEGGGPAQKWDVYSFGVIVLEMITGRSPETTLAAAGVGLVRWVQLCIEEERPLGELLDPELLAEEVEDEEEEKEEEEIVGALKMALSCVHSRPERRPSMRQVVDCLDRL
ncbi:leucine-rich repeat protein kinase family protein [Wolffia australiana]